MKRILKAFSIVLILLLNACTNTEKSHHEHGEKSSLVVPKTIYSCPMHSEISSEKPGVCPECKMDLLVKSDKSLNDSTEHSDHEKHQH